MFARFNLFRRLCLLLICLLFLAPAMLAVGPSEMDDFEDGTTENWQHGATGAQPTNEPDGGPGGTGDNYLQNVSTGTSGAGSRMAVFNETQWTGDYNALGSEVVISMMLANFGATALEIRLGVESAGVPMSPLGGGDRWVSTTAFALPADGVWRAASFTLSDSAMSQVGGSATLSDVLDNVAQVRILSSTTPSWQGDQIAGTLGVDDIEISQVPVELMSFSVD